MQRVRTQLGLTDLVLGRLRGAPVTAAVLDSGVSLHPDLEGAVIAFRDFTGYADRNKPEKRDMAPYDQYGHGTHVCGILGGNGKISGGRFGGIFPGMKLVVGKVLDERGEGSMEEMQEGLEWILSIRKQYEIRLLNISVGISNLREVEKQKRLLEVLGQFSKQGILVICAAGNGGPGENSLSALGEARGAVSVGCHDGAFFRNDPGRCAVFSGRGSKGSGIRKPDVVAPGTGIMSCSGLYRRGMPVRAAYQKRSGTSMAAAIVTGCLARTLQQNPDLTPEELKCILISTAADLGEDPSLQGYGMVNPCEMILRAGN